jgi:hypothetical protein
MIVSGSRSFQKCLLVVWKKVPTFVQNNVTQPTKNSHSRENSLDRYHCKNLKPQVDVTETAERIWQPTESIKIPSVNLHFRKEKEQDPS